MRNNHVDDTFVCLSCCWHVGGCSGVISFVCPLAKRGLGKEKDLKPSPVLRQSTKRSNASRVQVEGLGVVYLRRIQVRVLMLSARCSVECEKSAHMFTAVAYSIKSMFLPIWRESLYSYLYLPASILFYVDKTLQIHGQMLIK